MYSSATDVSLTVIPAKAGIQRLFAFECFASMKKGTGFRLSPE